MRTTYRDILQAARSFAGGVRTEVDMEKEVSIPLRTAVAVSYLADEFLAKLKTRISELEKQLQIGTAPNRGNAREELENSLELTHMLENNCVETLHKVIDNELHST